MALLLGVHSELLQSLQAIDRNALRLLARKEYSQFITRINGKFLLTIGVGVAISLASLRYFFHQYLSLHPIFVSSFFFSMVMVAAFVLLRKITRWSIGVIICLLTGVAFSYALTLAVPFATPDHALMAIPTGFLVGATFVVPGVSGAFMLMFFGKYRYILTSFDSLEFDVIILFIAGGVLGIILIARMLAYLLSKFYNITVAAFAGLMIGSLNKIWPWREVVEYTTVGGRRVPAFDNSILPWRYMELTGKDPQVIYAILMMAFGVFIVVTIEKITARLKTTG